MSEETPSRVEISTTFADRMPAKRGTKRDPIERKRHLARLAELYCKGKYQHELAAELDVSQQQISYDLRLLQRYWEQAAVTNIHHAKLKELAKIDELERTYWDAWAKSTQPRETKSLKQKPSIPRTDKKDKDGKVIASKPEEDTKLEERHLRQESQCGDPRYLEGVQWCIEKRSALLGLDKIDETLSEAAHTFAEKVQADLRKAREATLGSTAIDQHGKLVDGQPEVNNDAAMDTNQGS